MKKFRLILATVLVFVLTFALTACSAPVVGEWKLTKVEYDGTTYTLAEFCEEMGMGEGDISMTLKVESDGTFEYVTKSGSVSQTITGEWTFEDDELIAEVDTEGADDTVFVYENGELKSVLDMGSEGSMAWIFEKK